MYLTLDAAAGVVTYVFARAERAASGKRGAARGDQQGLNTRTPVPSILWV